jgi:phosphoglycolate phosphatase-like HAD superfamily hydrolase
MAVVGVPADRAMFIGDIWGVIAANRAGVPCIALRSGGISEAELTDAGAVAVYDDAAALLCEVDESPLADLWEQAS